MSDRRKPAPFVELTAEELELVKGGEEKAPPKKRKRPKKKKKKVNKKKPFVGPKLGNFEF